MIYNCNHFELLFLIVNRLQFLELKKKSVEKNNFPFPIIYTLFVYDAVRFAVRFLYINIDIQ